MKAGKICLGCFREWEADGRCPHCGWEREKQYEKILGWAPGDVFGQRYLLGSLYCRLSDAAVWRVYDKLLGISCYVMRILEGKSRTDGNVPKAVRQPEDSVKLLAAKEIGGKRALLFSMEDPVEDTEELLAALRTFAIPSEEQGQEIADIGETSQRAGQKKEQALPNGTLLDGRYQILDCIGIGGFGILYLCYDLALRRLIAMKEYFPAEWAWRDGLDVDVKKSQMASAYRFGIQSFLEEAKYMAKFLHTPHIADIYDILEDNDTVYLAMEYIPGLSIGREMRARGYQPYRPGEAAQILFPVMDALEALHEEKVVHGDVSPGNIMRTEDGSIFLIDLGAAKYALDSRPVFGAAFLKPDYAAPEQYRTAREGIPRGEGPWTDAYALGATMYYLLTGQKPPDVISRLEAKHAQIRFPRKCRLKHAKQWIKFFNRAMALDVKERIGSMGEFREEAAKLLC